MSKTVRAYDAETKTTATIPESELAAGMIPVRVINEQGMIDGDVVWHDAKDGTINSDDTLRHGPLTDLRPLFVWFSKLFRAGYARTPEEWELGFRGDMNYAKEVLLFAHAAEVFEDVVAGRNLDDDKLRDIFAVIMACMNAGPDRAALVADVRTLSKSRIREIASQYAHSIDPDLRAANDTYNEWLAQHPGQVPMGDLNEVIAGFLRRFIARRLQAHQSN